MAYPEIRILIKTAGDYEAQIIDKMSLHNLLIAKADDEGNISQDIVIFQDCLFEKADDGAIRWVLSDGTVDRDLERMDPAGWNLKEFKKNPIVLWSHESYRPALGKINSPRVRDGRLIGDVIFSSKEDDPFAGMIESKVRDGIISCGSVGFKSNKIEIVDDKNEDAILIHRKQTLYEFSICNIPANANATVIRSAEAPEIKKLSYIETLFEDVDRETSGGKKAPANDGSIGFLFDGVGRESSAGKKAPDEGKPKNFMEEFFDG